MPRGSRQPVRMPLLPFLSGLEGGGGAGEGGWDLWRNRLILGAVQRWMEKSRGHKGGAGQEIIAIISAAAPQQDHAHSDQI